MLSEPLIPTATSRASLLLLLVLAVDVTPKGIGGFDVFTTACFVASEILLGPMNEKMRSEVRLVEKHSLAARNWALSGALAVGDVSAFEVYLHGVCASESPVAISVIARDQEDVEVSYKMAEEVVVLRKTRVAFDAGIPAVMVVVCFSQVLLVLVPVELHTAVTAGHRGILESDGLLDRKLTVQALQSVTAPEGEVLGAEGKPE